MPIPKTDIATALYGSARAEEAVRDRQRTSTVAARATSDSSGGRVLVDFGGASVTGDGMQSVEVPTTVDVRAGDVVRVELVGADGTGKAPAVSGVVGGGDRTRRAVEEAQGVAADVAETRMLVASSSSAQDVAAKVATLGSGSLSLKSGASVTVVFEHANVAASPTLDVGGTGARPVMTNGAPYAYWVDGTAVSFVYDGTYWQVCSVPVYASTVTVGNPAARNVYIDGGAVSVRDALEVLASFAKDAIELGKNSASSEIRFCNDLGKVCERSISGFDFLTLASDYVSLDAASEASLRVARDALSTLASVTSGYDGTSSYSGLGSCGYSGVAQVAGMDLSVGCGSSYGQHASVASGPYLHASAYDSGTTPAHVRYESVSGFRAVDVLSMGEEIWANPDSSYGGGITGMSRSAADLAALLIVYQDNDGAFYSQYVPDPDGKVVGLFGFHHNASAFFIKCQKYRIGGTSMTTEDGWGGEWAFGATSGTGNVIRIVRVLGWEK